MGDQAAPEAPAKTVLRWARRIGLSTAHLYRNLPDGTAASACHLSRASSALLQSAGPAKRCQNCKRYDHG
ncbi:hypothetical protein SAMN05216548_10738 [Faunimonas pinastri]|uniref:Uncharacterized protein n=1 Tax=Faunimonas pinastri TaxID=1855383 RepID=A0A1H9IAM8_9HYPH|nr:hypothetical protein [Faunimonas pinastri]SEQ71610.1 hypothetical protein SAMN05216548_10738 [Faunimonas pinastri]